MAITLEAIRAAGGIVHSDGNIFFRDISMLQGLAGAAPVAVTPHGDYPQLPKHVTAYYDDVDHMEVRCFSESQMHAYFDLGRQPAAAPTLEAPAAPAPAVPDGWRLVPANPTDAMLGAAQKAWLADPLRRSSTLYVAALAAAPQAPAAPVDEQSARDSACAWSVWWTHNKAKFTTPRQAALAAWNHANERALRAMAAPAAPAVDVETIEDAARFRAIVDAALTDDEAFDLALRQYPELGDDATIDDVRAMFDAARAAVAAQAKEGGGQ